jgi:hypothetical protein
VAFSAAISAASHRLTAQQHFFSIIDNKREKEMKKVERKYVEGFSLSKCRSAVNRSMGIGA